MAKAAAAQAAADEAAAAEAAATVLSGDKAEEEMPEFDPGEYADEMYPEL